MTVGDAAVTRESGEDSREKTRDFLAVAAISLLFFALNIDFVQRGDASMYADYALLGKFDELTLHAGYYVLLFAVDRTLGAALGIPIYEMIVWINVVAGALALAVMYLLARHLLGTRRDALICVALVAVGGRVLANATTSEIYMVQMLFVMLSFLLFIEERAFLAGIAAALSLFISPLSVFAFLFYPVYDYQRAGTIRWRVLLLAAAGCLVVYLPFLIVSGSELLWGRRGLLAISGSHKLDFSSALVNLPKYQFKHYTVLLLLMLPALWAARKNLRLFILTLAVVVPTMYIVLKLPEEDHVFLLNTDFFFACWLAIGWRQLSRTAIAWAAPALLAGHLGLMIASGAIFDFNFHRGYAAEMRAVAQKYLIGKQAVLVADWDMVMSLTFYGRPDVVTTIERGELFKQMYDLGAIVEGRQEKPVADTIYVMDAWEPGPLRDLLSSDAAIAEQRSIHSIMPQAERILNLNCTLISTAANSLYRCSRKQGAPTLPPAR